MRKSIVLCAALALICALAVNGSPAFAQQKNKAIQIKGSDTMVNLGQAWAEAFNKRHPRREHRRHRRRLGDGHHRPDQRHLRHRRIVPGHGRQGDQAGRGQGRQAQPGDRGPGRDRRRRPSQEPDQEPDHRPAPRDFPGQHHQLEDGRRQRTSPSSSSRANSIRGRTSSSRSTSCGAATPRAPRNSPRRPCMMPSSQAIADEVASNENAVGYYGMGYISPQQKVIAVAKDAKSPFIEPTHRKRQIQHLPDLPAAVSLHQRKAPRGHQGFHRFRLFQGRPGDRQEDRLRPDQITPR